MESALKVPFAVFWVCLVRSWNQRSFERSRKTQLLRLGHFSDSWPALRLFFFLWWGLGRGYWEVALRKHPPLMRPTQLEPVCPCAAAARPLAEAMRTARRGSAGPHVELKDVRNGLKWNPQNFQKNLNSFSPVYALMGGKWKYIDDLCW